MKIAYNQVFKQHLTEYDLPENFSFSIDLPAEVQKILSDEILITEYGVTLKSFKGLRKATESWENQSSIEDHENHFHVDWLVQPADNKKAFMLGIKTLILLAEKFEKEDLTGIRFWYAFQTPELGLLWARYYYLEEEEDEHLLSDRLSFYTRREGEEIIKEERIESLFEAKLIIDI